MATSHNIRQTLMCRYCKETKSASDFYEGNRSTCKECTKARVRRRARMNPKVQEYDRKRAKSPRVKKRLQTIAKEWRKKNPDAYKAQTAVSNAVRDGRLEKAPCLFCGEKRVHAHHRDYSRPLDVIWLCPKCHHRLHAAFPETEGANKRIDEESRMSREIVHIDVEIVARTERAVLVHTGIKEQAAWLPLAQIEVSAAGYPGIHTITMPEWLASKEGFV